MDSGPRLLTNKPKTQTQTLQLLDLTGTSRVQGRGGGTATRHAVWVTVRERSVGHSGRAWLQVHHTRTTVSIQSCGSRVHQRGTTKSAGCAQIEGKATAACALKQVLSCWALGQAQGLCPCWGQGRGLVPGSGAGWRGRSGAQLESVGDKGKVVEESQQGPSLPPHTNSVQGLW